MKLSDVTVADLKLYCRVDGDGEDDIFKAILSAATAFIRNQTGLTDDEIDENEDLTMALYILAADFYDTRAYNIVGSNITVNPAAAAIINQHCRTLLI